MENHLVCSECQGSKAVSVRHEVRPLENDLKEWTLVPQSPQDEKLLHTVFPEVVPSGFVIRCQWGSVQRGQVYTNCVRVWLEKAKEGEPTKQTIDLSGKTATQLAEIAVMRGVTSAVPAWGKTRLLAEIEKAPQLVEA